jgi:dolichol-phosphate mannosyltransferase
MKKVVIIIPTYNEGEVILETIHEIAKIVAKASNYNINVLIFDSASKDNTQKIVESLKQEYEWLHMESEPTKTGLGSAYLKAMRHALNNMHADIVVEFDADLSHQPKYIFPMIEAIGEHDVVLGSRYVPGGSIPKDWGMQRKLISILGNQVAKLILTRKYKDFTSGFRMTRREHLQKAIENGFLSNHYAYKLHLLWALHVNGARVYEHPISFVDRVKGKSKLPANSIVDSLRVLLKLRLSKISKSINP